MNDSGFDLGFLPNGKANAENAIIFGNYRFTLITSRLIRIEYSPDKLFTDKISQAIWHRDLGRVDKKEEHKGMSLVLETADLILTCHDGESWGRASGFIALKSSSTFWSFGDPTPNLMGTARTLDGVSGKLPLGDGIVSESGFSVLNDSSSLLLDDNGWPIATTNKRQDFYFFGYGHDYACALKDYYRISGNVPLVPRFVLGNWWSKYWAYKDTELLNVVDTFSDYGIPLSVCIIDMDWHITAIPGVQDYWGGWTGYTVNKNLFPDFSGFIAKLHSRGLKTSVNLHPATGLKSYEEQYRAFALAIGVDPNEEKTIPFDSVDKRFMKAYFDILLHPYEDKGVDFWWVDWQQGSVSKIKGLDPLWMLNHLHYLDAARNTDKRPFVFSRWSGYGAQRYPIGFSGDAKVTWDSLAFEPYFTATAANIGFSMWSHDIGGHFGGFEEPELFARWVQFGMLSPVLRLHSTSNRFDAREPWRFGVSVKTVVTDAMRLRHKLIPYLYSACFENHLGGLPLVYPLYYNEPDKKEAYSAKKEYFFGPSLLACPVTKPMDNSINRAEIDVWFPEGRWIDWYTGEIFTGSQKHRCYFSLDHQGLFAKAGAIIPLADHKGLSADILPDRFLVRAFPENDGEYTLIEDDGASQSYLKNDIFRTVFQMKCSENEVLFSITPDSEIKSYIPKKRTYDICLENFRAADPNQKFVQDGRSCRLIISALATESLFVRIKGEKIQANEALLSSLDAFLVDIKASADSKTAVYNAFVSGTSKKEIKKSFAFASDIEKRFLESLLSRLDIKHPRKG